jgi:hypothetical protein
MPYNPLIAGAFFRSGQIEAGVRHKKNYQLMQGLGKPGPFYEVRSNYYIMIGKRRPMSEQIAKVKALYDSAPEFEWERMDRNPFEFEIAERML